MPCSEKVLTLKKKLQRKAKPERSSAYASQRNPLSKLPIARRFRQESVMASRKRKSNPHNSPMRSRFDVGPFSGKAGVLPLFAMDAATAPTTTVTAANIQFTRMGP